MDIDFKLYETIIDQIKILDNKTDNIFKILHQESYENKHSIFLSWLFNPKASHGFKDKFAQNFFDTVFEKDENYKVNKLDARKIKKVSTEVRINGKQQQQDKKDKRRIDILIEGEDFTCTIENKYGSRAHGGQCKDYKDYVQQTYKQFGEKNKFVFLDIERPNDFDDNQEEYANYVFVSYKTIKEELNKLIKDLDKSKVQTIFIKQYLEILSELYKGKTDDEYCEILKKIDFKEVLKICAITDKEYEVLDTDTKRFVDEVIRFYWKEKNNIDTTIHKCLEAICQDSSFFKSDYGNTKEIYAYTIPVSIEFLDKINYLSKTDKLSKTNKPYKITEEQANNLRKLEEEEKKISSLKKKLKNAKGKEKIEIQDEITKTEYQYECDKVTFNDLINLFDDKIKEIKELKDDKGTIDIYLQTVDYKAPTSKCKNLSIIILAGFVPRFSKYLCNNFTIQQAEKLFSLEQKGWKLRFFFYVRNGSGNPQKEDSENVEKELDMQKNKKRLMDVLNIGKKEIIKNKQFFGKRFEAEEVKQNLDIFHQLDYYRASSEKISIEEKIKELLDRGVQKQFSFGCAIELLYEIDKNLIDKKEELQKIFKEKTLEGTNVYGYDDWFRRIIFK